MPVGGPRLVPIFGGPARNFRCIIYGRFNEPRKRSKGPRGLFLIIRRRQREELDGLATCSSFLLLYFLFFLLFFFFSSSLASLSHQSPDTPSFVAFDNALSPDASKVILITRNIIEARRGASERRDLKDETVDYTIGKNIGLSFDRSFSFRVYQRAKFI